MQQQTLQNDKEVLLFFNWPKLTIPILFLFQTDLTALLTDITQ
jgi:hypothetical protein